jgi:hypothetical protein
MRKLLGIFIIALGLFMIGNISTPLQAICSTVVIPAMAMLVSYLFHQKEDEFVPPITK